eukprot:g7183.t1
MLGFCNQRLAAAQRRTAAGGGLPGSLAECPGPRSAGGTLCALGLSRPGACEGGGSERCAGQVAALGTAAALSDRLAVAAVQSEGLGKPTLGQTCSP